MLVLLSDYPDSMEVDTACMKAMCEDQLCMDCPLYENFGDDRITIGGLKIKLLSELLGRST